LGVVGEGQTEVDHDPAARHQRSLERITVHVHDPGQHPRIGGIDIDTPTRAGSGRDDDAAVLDLEHAGRDGLTAGSEDRAAHHTTDCDPSCCVEFWGAVRRHRCERYARRLNDTGSLGEHSTKRVVMTTWGMLHSRS